MQFKNILAATAGMAVVVSATLTARDDAAVIVHEVVTYSPSVVYSTRIQTVTQCAANVTNCPEVSGALTSIIDSTTTICPVTATAISTSGVPNPANPAPLQTFTLTNSNAVSEWTSTVVNQTTTVTLSDTISTMTLSELSSASTLSSQSGNTLVSPEDETKTGITGTSTVRSTSFVYATVTLPANAPGTASGSSSFANNTVTVNTAASSFSTNAVGALTGTASGTFSYSANGTLATPTAPTAATASEPIVPFLGQAAHDVGSPLLALAMLAIVV